jgi:very-short-patch-repair endonuclease
VVELDGHAFHERTKEQAAKDKARDRWMTGAGYAVVRFTGSEVWANPFAVASEVADRVHQLRYGKSRKDALAEAGFAAIRALLAG